MVQPVSMTTLNFDGKSEKFELFEDLHHLMVKMQLYLTETRKMDDSYPLSRKIALQTFRNIDSANRQTIENSLAGFRRQYVTSEF